MKSFKEVVNEEVQWQRSLFDHIFMEADGLLADDKEYIFQDEKDKSFHIILDQKFLERVSTPVRLIAAHSSGVKGLDKLKKLQNKRTKQISAFTVDNIGAMLYGIWDDGGGVITILEGTALMGQAGDIMSKPDKKGTRVIDISGDSDSSIMSSSYIEFFLDGESKKSKMTSAEKEMKFYQYKLLLQKLVIFKQSLLEKLRDEYGDKENDYTPYDISGDVKQKYIRQYVAGTERIIKSKKEYRKVFNELIMRWPNMQSKKWTSGSKYLDYDEIVLSDFKILQVYYIEDALKSAKVTNSEFREIVKGLNVQIIDEEEHQMKPNIVKKYIDRIKKIK